MQELVLWKGKQNWKAFNTTDSSGKKEDSNNTIRNEKGEIATDTTEIQRTVRNYYEELYAKKFENLGEMDKFLEKYCLPKLKAAAAESLNKLTFGEIEAVIKKFLAHRSPGVDGFTEEFYKAFKEELTPILHRLFQKKFKKVENSQTLFMKPASS